MKKIVAIIMLLFSTAVVFSEDQNKSFKVGFQADSDTYMGLLVKADHLEFGLKAQWGYMEDTDGNDTNGIVVGGHLAYLLHGKDESSSLGAGIDFRTFFGEPKMAEYVDAFMRINYNYHISENFMLSALYYPFSFTTRESSGGGDWYISITVPSAALAATVFF
ncbi:MAG: hypothetical protein KAH95_00695 [Spirochaetales bacterium]|nr:hypothetical protein [Spirochaetales bacterium]